MDTTEIEFRELAYRLFRGHNDGFINVEHLRAIHITPYDGAYGNAGYVITINGSPPRGTFITVAFEQVIYVTQRINSRRLIPAQRKIVLAFLKAAGYTLRPS